MAKKLKGSSKTKTKLPTERKFDVDVIKRRERMVDFFVVIHCFVGDCNREGWNDAVSMPVLAESDI
jgi:hypothetical protein